MNMQMKQILVGCASLVVLPLAYATESEANAVFKAGVEGVLTFRNDRMVVEMTSGLSHFTIEGRAAVIEELKRTGIVRQATAKNGSLSTVVKEGFNSTAQVGASGLNEYLVNARATFQWQRCVNKTCVPVGDALPGRVSGTVQEVQVNGRPAYRINSIQLDGAQQ